MLTDWPCPHSNGGHSQEMALAFDKAREHRVLIIPSLFDEANKMRRQLVEVMRRLDLSGIDTILPDLPGWNESLQSLEEQSLTSWKEAMKDAAEHFSATRIFTVRAGAILAPDNLPGWRYAPTGGKQILRSLLRARTISARESGREETTAGLQEQGRSEGLELAGWKIGATLFSQLEGAAPAPSDTQAVIEQGMIGGAGLWMRAEPDDDPEQADALAAIIAIGLSDI